MVSKDYRVDYKFGNAILLIASQLMQGFLKDG